MSARICWGIGVLVAGPALFWVGCDADETDDAGGSVKDVAGGTDGGGSDTSTGEDDAVTDDVQDASSDTADEPGDDAVEQNDVPDEEVGEVVWQVQLDPVACDSDDAILPDGWAAILDSYGFTKCVSPFGVVIAGQATTPDEYIGLSARIAAELIDPDMDGVPNDPTVHELLHGGTDVWFPMPVDEVEWTGGDEAAIAGELGAYGIQIPMWCTWADGDPIEQDAIVQSKAVHAVGPSRFGTGEA